MAALLEDDVFNTTHLFYSNNMASLDYNTSLFHSPWLYRSTVAIAPPKDDEHVFVITHGITSKADIFFNGEKIAKSDVQKGSYTGGVYDVTGLIAKKEDNDKKGKSEKDDGSDNVLLINAYPTNYLRDFAQGFVDWNPYPADNGTGVWRDVEIKRTGSVLLSSPRVVTDYKGKGENEVKVTVKADVVNVENRPVKGSVQGHLTAPDGASVTDLEAAFHLEAGKNTTVSMTTVIKDPSIWWPAGWGKQPMYTVSLNASIPGSGVSDVAGPARFGIRNVSSRVNKHNDTEFSVNGHSFHVRGGGYAPDMFLRFDVERIKTIFEYMLDMGLNTVRLEGNQEHAELYELADEMGLMVLAGWECCDKWEGWDVSI